MKRASGTFWELQLVRNWPIIAFFAMWAGIGTSSVAIGTGVFLILGALAALVELWTYTRFDLKELHCGTHLLLDRDQVLAHEVQCIRPIVFGSGGGGASYHFVEIQYLQDTVTVNALCRAKPRWLFHWGRENPTIRIILKHLPELRSKVLDQYNANSYKEVRDPTARRPDPPPVEYAEPSPTARYHDPDFQRRRR